MFKITEEFVSQLDGHELNEEFIGELNAKCYNQPVKDITSTGREVMDKLNRSLMKPNLPKIQIGDTVKIGVKIIEGTKERVQFYEGTVLAKKNSFINTTITVRKVLQGIGIERIFLIHSPKVDSIEILRNSKVRRSKLYYLRNLRGKASRLKQSFK